MCKFYVYLNPKAPQHIKDFVAEHHNVKGAGSPCAMLIWLEANASIQNNSGLPQGLAGLSVAG